MGSAKNWSKPSTSSLDIRRLAPDSRVSRSSRRRQSYHRRRFSSCDCRVDRCSGIRCQNVVCFWDRCQNNGRYDDDGGGANLLDDADDEAETMTSSTLLTGRCCPSDSAEKTSYILHHAVPINIFSLFIVSLSISINCYFLKNISIPIISAKFLLS